MTHTEPDEGNARVTRSRKPLAIAGAAGLAVVLGSAAYLVTAQIADDGDTVVRDTGAMAPLAPAAVPSTGDTEPATPRAEPTTSAPTAAKQSSSPTPTATRTKSRAEIVEEVKGTAARADNVKRNLPQVGTALNDDDVTVTDTGTLKTDGATLRVVSAKGDLAGQRELALVGDAGQAVGDALCSQKVRFTAGGQVVEKPTLMICWRTSASRSVYTVAVVKQGRPSAEKSVAAITSRWAELG